MLMTTNGKWMEVNNKLWLRICSNNLKKCYLQRYLFLLFSPQKQKKPGFPRFYDGGSDWDWTSDPCNVNAVLSWDCYAIRWEILFRNQSVTANNHIRVRQGMIPLTCLYVPALCRECASLWWRPDGDDGVLLRLLRGGMQGTGVAVVCSSEVLRLSQRNYWIGFSRWMATYYLN